MGMSASQARLLFVTARMTDAEYQAQSISNSKIRLSQQSEEVSQKYSDALDKKTLKMQSGFNGSTGAPTYSNANAALLTNYSSSSLTSQRILRDSSGRVAVSDSVFTAYSDSNQDLNAFLQQSGVITDVSDKSYDSAKVNYYTRLFNEMQEEGCTALTDDQMASSDWLYEQLSNGNLYLSKWNNSLSTTSEDGDTVTGGFEDISWKSGDATLQETTDNNDVAAAEAEYDAAMAKIETQEKKYDLELKNIETEHTALQTEIDSIKKVIDKNVEQTFKIFNS